MSINIGDNNKMRNVSISENSKCEFAEGENKACERKNFAARYPVISGIFIAVVAGLILMLGFWDKLIALIEGLF